MNKGQWIRITNRKLWCCFSLARIIQKEKDGGFLAMLDRSTPNIVYVNNSDFEMLNKNFEVINEKS